MAEAVTPDFDVAMLASLMKDQHLLQPLMKLYLIHNNNKCLSIENSATPPPAFMGGGYNK